MFFGDSEIDWKMSKNWGRFLFDIKRLFIKENKNKQNNKIKNFSKQKKTFISMKKIILLSNNNKKSLEFIKYFKNDKNLQVSLVFLANDNIDLFSEYKNIKFIKHSDLEKLNVRLFKDFRELNNKDLFDNNFCKKTFLKMIDFHSFDKGQYTENEKNNLFEKTLNLVINLLEQVKPD